MQRIQIYFITFSKMVDMSSKEMAQCVNNFLDAPASAMIQWLESCDSIVVATTNYELCCLTCEDLPKIVNQSEDISGHAPIEILAKSFGLKVVVRSTNNLSSESTCVPIPVTCFSPVGHCSKPGPLGLDMHELFEDSSSDMIEAFMESCGLPLNTRFLADGRPIKFPSWSCSLPLTVTHRLGVDCSSSLVMVVVC
jgi:hypothetical protein